MGKKRHSQDKMWITYKEMIQDWSGKDDNNNSLGYNKKNEKLPFYYCCLSFLPFKEPVCTVDGSIFENSMIIPYIAKFDKNPITGNPISIKDIIKLNFHTNKENIFDCPITMKVFNDASKIIAIKETGNVYSFEAYDELNKKPKNYRDLLNDEPFDSKNVILLHDPNEIKPISSFHFLKNREEVNFITHLVHNPPEDILNDNTGELLNNNINIPSNYAKLIKDYNNSNDPEKLRKLQVIDMINNRQDITKNDIRNKKCNEEIDEYLKRISLLESNILNGKCSLKEIKVNEIFSMSTNCFIHYLKQDQKWKKYLNKSSLITNGKMALSLTSTGMDLNTQSSILLPSDEELRSLYSSIVELKNMKGYIRIITTLGEMNIELHCDKAPLSTENFLELSHQGYYHNTLFHRIVKGFIIQGGDPSGTGTGGESIYGKRFKDEFDKDLIHNKRGILLMANNGKDTNGSQFFITLNNKGTMSFNNKHTIIGHIVGGLKTLEEIEKIDCNDKEKPNEDINIFRIEVFHNPFRKVISEMLLKEFEEKYGLDEQKQFAQDLLLQEKLNKLLPNVKIESEDNIVIGKYLRKKREHEGNQRMIQKLMEKEEQYTFNKPKKAKELFGDWLI